MRIALLQPAATPTTALATPAHTSAITPMEVPQPPGGNPPLRARPRRQAAVLPPLVPLDDSAMTGKQALVALDGEFSEQRLAEVQAHQITLQAAQSALAKQLPQATPAPRPDSIAARFAAGTLQPVYLDTAAFDEMTASLPGTRVQRPARCWSMRSKAASSSIWATRLRLAIPSAMPHARHCARRWICAPMGWKHRAG